MNTLLLFILLVFQCATAQASLYDCSEAFEGNDMESTPAVVKINSMKRGEVARSNIFYNFSRLKNTVTRLEEPITVSGRPFTSYATRLLLTEQMLEPIRGNKKNILDIGGGLSEFTDVANKFFDSNAVSIDEMYADPALKPRDMESLRIFNKTRIPMDARSLSFKNRTFDLVVSNTVLCWFFFGSGVPSEARLNDGFNVLEEVIRVLKVGGEARITHVPSPESVENEILLYPNPAINKVQRMYIERMLAFKTNHPRVNISFPETSGSLYLTVIKKSK